MFHALGHCAMVHPFGDGNDVQRDGVLGIIQEQLINEVFVDLQAIHVKLALSSKRRIAYTKIINVHAHAGLFQCREDSVDIGVIARKGAFRDFYDDVLGCRIHLLH